MTEKLKDLCQKSNTELRALWAKKREELVKVRLDLKLKRIKNVHNCKFIRKEIARILTIIREKELIKEDKRSL